MRDVFLVAFGVALGGFVAGILIQPSDCCVRVAAGVRERVGDELGPVAQAVGDLFGVWKYAPGALTALGVEP